MNKYIISTTGSQIEFNLSSTRKVVLDPIVPTEVSEIEFTLLYSRLGSSIREVDMTSTIPAEEKTEEKVEENIITETPVEETKKEVEVTETETPITEEKVEETI